MTGVRERCLPSNCAAVGVENELRKWRDDQRGVGAVRAMNEHHRRLLVDALSRDTGTSQRIFDVRQPAAGVEPRQPLVTWRVHVVTCYMHTPSPK